MPTTWTTLVLCARESGAPVVAIFELCDWLGRKGAAEPGADEQGGLEEIAGLRVTMTDARHSTGFVDNGQMIYMGEAAGFVIGLEDGRPSTSPATPASSATCG